MSVLRNSVIVLGALIFAVTANAAANQNAKPQSKVSTAKVVATQSNAKRININTADIKTLQQVKGIGEKKALAIVNYRKKNLFDSIDGLLKIKCHGVNKKWLDQVKKFLTV
jgi:competence protein ComEA